MPTVNLRRLLVPVDPTGLGARVAEQAGFLARRFGAEVVLLGVNDPDVPSLPGAQQTTLAEAANHLKRQSPEVTVRSCLAEGAIAQAIPLVARQESADLIVMDPRGRTFERFLLRAGSQNTPEETECPLWTDTYGEARPFSLDRIVAAVDFRPDHRHAVDFAVGLATACGAQLTLAHVTEAVGMWGPGGLHADPQLREQLVEPARERLERFRDSLPLPAELFIGSGELAPVLAQAVSQAKADLLVVGCRPYGVHLRTHAFPVLQAVPAPVVSF